MLWPHPSDSCHLHPMARPPLAETTNSPPGSTERQGLAGPRFVFSPCPGAGELEASLGSGIRSRRRSPGRGVRELARREVSGLGHCLSRGVQAAGFLSPFPAPRGIREGGCWNSTGGERGNRAPQPSASLPTRGCSQTTPTPGTPPDRAVAKGHLLSGPSGDTQRKSLLGARGH